MTCKCTNTICLLLGLNTSSFKVGCHFSTVPYVVERLHKSKRTLPSADCRMSPPTAKRRDGGF